jgi:hypothetical protein
MPQNALNRFVSYAQPIEIRRQASAKCVPTVPLNTGLAKYRQNGVVEQIIGSIAESVGKSHLKL